MVIQSRMRDLNRGAVAMLDALGIKGICERVGGSYDTSALTTLKAMRYVVEGMRRYCAEALIPRVLAAEFADYGAPDVQSVAMSDTIVLSATLPRRSDVPTAEQRHVDALLVDVVSQCAASVLRFSPQAEPPLVYRGVVTFGDVLVEPPFYLGPAIDDAATHHNDADGSFVWLMPGAEVVVRQLRPYAPHVWENIAIPYEVPLKSGKINTIALSPFVDTVDPEEISRIRAGTERAMESDDPGVVRKRENTLRFLARAVPRR